MVLEGQNGQVGRQKSIDFFTLIEETREKELFFDLVQELQGERMDNQRADGPSPGGVIVKTGKMNPECVVEEEKPAKKAKKNNKNNKNKEKENRKEKTEAELIREQMAEEMKEDNMYNPDVEKNSWYAGSLSRKEAETTLSYYKDGTYLVRQGGDGGYVFSIKWNLSPGQGFCTHVKIRTPDNTFQLCEIDDFPNLVELVRFYHNDSVVFAKRFWTEACEKAPLLIAYDEELHASEIQRDREEEQKEEEKRRLRQAKKNPPSSVTAASPRLSPSLPPSPSPSSQSQLYEAPVGDHSSRSSLREENGSLYEVRSSSPASFQQEEYVVPGADGMQEGLYEVEQPSSNIQTNMLSKPSHTDSVRSHTRVSEEINASEMVQDDVYEVPVVSSPVALAPIPMGNTPPEAPPRPSRNSSPVPPRCSVASVGLVPSPSPLRRSVRGPAPTHNPPPPPGRK